MRGPEKVWSQQLRLGRKPLCFLSLLLPPSGSGSCKRQERVAQVGCRENPEQVSHSLLGTPEGGGPCLPASEALGRSVPISSPVLGKARRTKCKSCPPALNLDSWLSPNYAFLLMILPDVSVPILPTQRGLSRTANPGPQSSPSRTCSEI